MHDVDEVQDTPRRELLAPGMFTVGFARVHAASIGGEPYSASGSDVSRVVAVS